MCGLFGVLSSSLSKGEIENAIFLGVLSSTRGVDSTGIVVFGRGKKGRTVHKVHKRLGNSVSFFSDHNSMNAIQVNNPFIFMGHARAATLGAVNLFNAHPIEENNIICCHNGSIGHFLKDKYDVKDSDSRELSRRLSKQPIEDVLRGAGTGAYAISYADISKSTISFVRNIQRPLWFMYTIGGGTMYWASEEWMLKALAFRKYDANFKAPFQLKSDNLFEVNFGSVNGKNIELDLSWFAKKDDKRSSIFDKSPVCKFCEKLEKYCECIKPELLRLPGPSVPIGGSLLYQGYMEVKLLPAAVLPCLKAGCANCNKPATIAEPVMWFDDDAWVHKDCYENDPVCQTYMTKDLRVYESKLLRPN